VQVLGKDYTFPHNLDGLPAKLSEFDDLQKTGRRPPSRLRGILIALLQNARMTC
jgi:hypothetical protein